MSLQQSISIFGLVSFFVVLVMSCDKPNAKEANSVDQEEIPSLEEFSKVEDYKVATTKTGMDTISEIVKMDPVAAVEEKVEKKTPVKKKPKRKLGEIAFDSILHRLPAMQEGEKVSVSFGFENVGDGPLQIKTAEVTCGCTTPSIPFLDIEPGDRGAIAIDYNSVNKYGHQEPEITITTNGKPRKVTLKLSVDILEKPKADSTTLDSLSN